jgi:hypothetical protein
MRERYQSGRCPTRGGRHVRHAATTVRNSSTSRARDIGARAASKRGMSFIHSPISLAYQDVEREVLALDQVWNCEHERASLRHAAADLRHHVCAAVAWFDQLVPPPTRLGELDVAGRILAHEAFLAVLALGQLLVRAEIERYAHRNAIVRAQDAVDATLDALTPFVTSADDALRRVLLENASIASVTDGDGRGQ